MNAAEITTKAAVVDEAKRELDARALAHEICVDELGVLEHKVRKAQTVFDETPDEQSAIALSLAQHRLPRARADQEAAAAALAGARDVHQQAAEELARTQAEADRRARIVDLAAKATSFEVSAGPLTARIVDLVAEMRKNATALLDALLEARAAATELSRITGEPTREPDGVPIAAAVIQRFRADGVAVHERALGVFVPMRIDDWIGPLAGFIARALGSAPSSPGELAHTDALHEALNGSTNFQEARHKLLLGAVNHTPVEPYVSQVRYPAPGERARR